MKSCLYRLDNNTPVPVTLNVLEKTGQGARHTIINKYKTLPELYSGFYHTFIDADKKFNYNKAVANEKKGGKTKWHHLL